MLMVNLKSILLFVAPGIFVSYGCSSFDNAPLLEGKINVSEPTEITFYYDYNGNTFVENVSTDSTGLFVFNPQLAGNEADVALYVGSNSYGAFLEKGKSVKMDIDGKNVTFQGDNTDRSTFYNAYQQGFSPWIFKPSPDHPFSTAEWNANLDAGYEAAQNALKDIKDATVRERYARLADASKKYYTIQILGMDSIDHQAQIDSLVATIDPNADESRLSGLINHWYNRANLGNNNGTLQLTPYFIKQFADIDSALTNESNKKYLYATLSSMFFLYQPSDSDITAFVNGIQPQLVKDSLLAAKIKETIAKRNKHINDGDVFPSDPVLISRDGTKTCLSEVIKGKVAYIDFWATWCVPCCKEIPFMEKVYEKFKDNENIVFVSISQDDNRKAWEKKVDRDNPQWPNFIFDVKTGREFLDAMGINAIPRFIIVGRDGKIISVDAARPSNKDIEKTLNEALGK